MVLVTGGSGMIGSHLLYELVRGEGEVRALMRGNSPPELVRQLFNWYDPVNGEQLFSRIEWITGDVNDIVSLRDALEGVDFVYHCAAVVSFLPGDRRQMMKVNVEGTANLVNLSIQSGVKKLCHCSSVAAIGRPDRGNLIDESLVWKTSGSNSWYAISKYGSEREVWRATEEGLKTVIVNPTIVIGPGDPSRSSAQLYLSVKKGLKFYTKGVTGFVDARDVAKAMVLLMESELSGERYILTAENLSYQKIFELLAHYAGTKPPRFYATRTMTELGWRLEKLRSLVTGNKPLITKETARSGQGINYFSNKKFVTATGFQFRTIAEAAENTANFFKKHKV